MSGPKFILLYVDILKSRKPGLNTWVRKICWRREHYPLPYTGLEHYPLPYTGLEHYPLQFTGLEHYPLPYTGLENSTDRRAWWVAKSWTQLRDLHFHFYPVVPAAFVEEIIHFSLNGLGTLVENHLAVEVRIYF